MLHVVVDAANVVGARPDGWWRDRPGAARRLAGRIVAALTVDPARLAEHLGHPDADLQVHLVLEGAAARVEDLPRHPRLAVVHATADGDSTIAALAAELAAEPVLVVTADRALRDRVRASGSATVGPGTLLNALPPP
ncbi:hypothetical protein [Pseudonocardia adelaidensis]|uniref:YacP-like NYN domain-containing protein n=1 Tax=Pseudonocardia adelaidensis TaxID=648754 RepID=A0ABP9NL95_9PSEU